MDEYIKREDAISALCFGCNQEFSDEPCEPNECALRQAIKAVPTADVVPKSEVERLQEMLDATIAGQETLQKSLVNAKAEVAREIFAEIEEILEYWYSATPDSYSGVILTYITELKKKYIPQECPTCKHMLSCEPNVFGICEEYEEKET